MKKHLLALAVVLASAVFAYAGDGPDADAGKYRFGIGAGVPYGGFGIGLEAYPMDKVSLALGLGSTAGGLGWAAGARFYPVERAGRFWPRLSAYYGVVAVLEDANGKATGTRSGAAFGAGLDIKTDADSTMDFEFLVLQDDTPVGYVRKDSGNVAVSLGWGFYF